MIGYALVLFGAILLFAFFTGRGGDVWSAILEGGKPSTPNSSTGNW